MSNIAQLTHMAELVYRVEMVEWEIRMQFLLFLCMIMLVLLWTA